jgi:hypothetical protein
MTICCEDMQQNISTHCAYHVDRFSCPDSLINYNPVFDEYGSLGVC